MSVPRPTIRRRPTRPVEVEQPSNVVPLRPGIMFPAAPDASKPDQKRTRAKVTSAPDFLTKVTRETGKKSSESSDLLRGPGLTQVIHSQALSPSPENAVSAKDPAFQRRVAKMSATKLRDAFPLEASSHRNMLGRERDSAYTVDPAFRNFRTFLANVGPRPSEDFTLDRRDPRNPVYGPGLVRWSDKREQANNRADTVHLTLDGVTRPLADWARLTGQERRTLAKRIDRGWSHAEAIRGRRIENEPAPGAMPSPTPATAPALDAWPAEASAERWEPAFVTFQQRFDDRLGPHFRRAVFFAWLTGNKVRLFNNRLRIRYPGFDDPEFEASPSLEADPDYTFFVKLARVHDTAFQAVLSDADAYAVLRGLKDGFPRQTDPVEASRMKFERAESSSE